MWTFLLKHYSNNHETLVCGFRLFKETFLWWRSLIGVKSNIMAIFWIAFSSKPLHCCWVMLMNPMMLLWDGRFNLCASGSFLGVLKHFYWHTFVPANRRPRRSARNRLPRGVGFLLWEHPHPSLSPAKSEIKKSNKVMFCWNLPV